MFVWVSTRNICDCRPTTPPPPPDGSRQTSISRCRAVCEGRCSLSASWYNALKRFCYCITWTLHVVASIREPSAWLWWPGASQELCGNHGLRSRLVFLHRVSLAMTVSESTWLKQSWHLKVVSNVHSIISEAIVWIEESVGTSNRGST